MPNNSLYNFINAFRWPLMHFWFYCHRFRKDSDLSCTLNYIFIETQAVLKQTSSSSTYDMYSYAHSHCSKVVQMNLCVSAKMTTHCQRSMQMSFSVCNNVARGKVCIQTTSEVTLIWWNNVTCSSIFRQECPLWVVQTLNMLNCVSLCCQLRAGEDMRKPTPSYLPGKIILKCDLNLVYLAIGNSIQAN